MAIPWSALVSDSTKLEVSGLELTLRPALREEAGNIFCAEYSFVLLKMTTSPNPKISGPGTSG